MPARERPVYPGERFLGGSGVILFRHLKKPKKPDPPPDPTGKPTDKK